VAYQWRADGADVPGATGPTFTVGEEQLGQRLRVRVTASKLGYPTATATSLRTARVVSGTLTNNRASSITGEPVVDGTLTADPGGWTPAPDKLSFQWLADGVPIEGAVREQLVVGAALADRSLAVRVRASRTGFADVSLTSAATEPVKRAAFTTAPEPVVSGLPRLGETLHVDPGASAPAGSATVDWLRDGQVVAGADGPSYVLTADDLGARISARVGWNRPGYVPVQTHSAATPLVKATPTVEVELTPRAARLRIRADVLVPAGAAGPAHVWVRTGRIRESVPLVEGSATTVLTGLRAATRTVRVVVPGGATVQRTLVVDEVTIP
jgi:hypothetical protein